MNTLLSWALPLFEFLFSLNLTSAIGLVCYVGGRHLNDHAPDALLVIGFLLGVIDVCLALSTPTVFIFTLVLLAICSVGTFAERAAHPTAQSWGQVILRMCLTTVCSILLSLLLLVASAVHAAMIVSGLFNELWFQIGAILGMFLSPSVIPIFIWLWKGSYLRPGVDRPLEDNETFL